MAIAERVLTGQPRRGAARPEPHGPDRHRGAKPHVARTPTASGTRTHRRARIHTLARRVAIGCAVIGIFAVVIAHVLIDENQFRIDAMQSRLAAAQSLNTNLSYQVAQLESPQRIIIAAQQNLGMVAPGSVTYLAPVTPGSAVPAPPTPHATFTTPSTTQAPRTNGHPTSQGTTPATSPTTSRSTSPPTSPPTSAASQVSHR